MQIYYINLARRTDRRAFMEAQFTRLGLAATRIEAVTPEELSAADIERYCNPARGTFLMPIELCCGLSHCRALQAAIAADVAHAVILEDDVLLSARLPEFLSGVETLAPTVDLLRLETTFERMRLLPAPLPAFAGVRIFQPYSWASGAAAYVISRRGAQLALASSEFWRKPADQVLCNPYEPVPRRLRGLQVNPALAVQTDRLPAGPRLESDMLKHRYEGMRLARTHFWRRRPQAIADWVNRDLLVGAQKAWHQYVRGADKQPVPFTQD